MTAGLIKPADAEALRNHCLFVNLYRVKKRLFLPRTLVASAEPQDDGRWDGESDGSVVVTESQLDRDNYVDRVRVHPVVVWRCSSLRFQAALLSSLVVLLSHHPESAMLVHGSCNHETLAQSISSPLRILV